MRRFALLTFVMIVPVLSAQQQINQQNYVPGVSYQSTNPNYFQRNPFYFEGRIDWNLLNITTPSNAWEFVQRGIHNQDDLEDLQSAIADYRQALTMNSLSNNTCQLITAANAVQGFGQTTNPPPCMFTPRLRLGNLLMKTDPQSAISLFQEVLTIDPLRLGVNAFIGEAWEVVATNATSDADRLSAYNNALAAYNAELALSPVTAQSTQLTGDKANNAHVHWSMAEIAHTLGRDADEAVQLQAYLDATQWHSDTYPWRIALAKARLAKLAAK